MASAATASPPAPVRSREITYSASAEATMGTPAESSTPGTA
jgi:hypothetical protein